MQILCLNTAEAVELRFQKHENKIKMSNRLNTAEAVELRFNSGCES